MTEDYSSYESVDEEEEPPAAAKAKSKTSKVNKVDEDSDAPVPKPKPLARKGSKLVAPTRKPSNGKTGQQTMMSFFGKK